MSDSSRAYYFVLTLKKSRTMGIERLANTMNIKRHLFIISKLMNGGKTLEELNSLWEESDNYDGDITPKSFWRYKNDIADAFNLDIEYNASSKLYELQDVEYIKSNRLLSYILISYQLPEVCLLVAKHKDKITTDITLPINIGYIPTILHAFENRHYIIYCSRNNPEKRFEAIPLHILINENRIYIRLRIKNDKNDTLIFLYDICKLTLSTEKF